MSYIVVVGMTLNSQDLSTTGSSTRPGSTNSISQPNRDQGAVPRGPNKVHSTVILLDDYCIIHVAALQYGTPRPFLPDPCSRFRYGNGTTTSRYRFFRLGSWLFVLLLLLFFGLLLLLLFGLLRVEQEACSTGLLC
uniref:Uncharacterized protein n=1 Tax=Arundo donax TaxID=35708 RepID=A0A0A9E6X9_ARUDO